MSKFTNDGSKQLRDAIRQVIHRHCQKSDLTYATILGVLELMKAELADKLKNDPNADEEKGN